MNYKNLVFDFGNVIGWFKTDYILKQFCSNEEDIPLLKKVIFRDWGSIDAGTADYDEYAAVSASLLPPRLKPASDAFFKDWYRFLPPVVQTWEFIHDAKKQGYRIFLLSNAPTYFAEHADFYEIIKEFDGIVFSAPIRMAKPDAAIYRYLFDTFRLNPKECFFLDDRLPNIEAARALGMDGIVYTGDISAVRRALDL